MKYVVFRVADEKYALPVQQVQSIEIIPQIRPIPTPPKHVVGVSNLRGVITTIVDMRSVFSIEVTAQRTSESRILVTESGAYIVDGVQDVMDIDEAELEPWEGNERVRGVLNNGKDLILVLEVIESVGEAEVAK